MTTPDMMYDAASKDQKAGLTFTREIFRFVTIRGRRMMLVSVWTSRRVDG
jgi:hypothetical protein